MINEIMTVLLAMTPLIGIRGAIPVAITVYEMSIPSAYFFSVLGEFIPFFIILAFLEPVSKWLSANFSFMKKFFDFLFEKTRGDYNGRVQKYGLFALFLFTGIPLPFSGVWTASLVVFLFGLHYWKSAVAVFCGTLLAGANLVLITQGGVSIQKYHGTQVLAGAIIFALFVYFIYYRRKVNSKKNVKSSTVS